MQCIDCHRGKMLDLSTPSVTGENFSYFIYSEYRNMNRKFATCFRHALLSIQPPFYYFSGLPLNPDQEEDCRKKPIYLLIYSQGNRVLCLCHKAQMFLEILTSDAAFAFQYDSHSWQPTAGTRGYLGDFQEL